MQFRTFLSYVREIFTEPITWTKWPSRVALLKVILSSLLYIAIFIAIIELLAKSNLPDWLLLVAGILLSIAILVNSYINSRRIQPSRESQPLPAIEKAFSWNIIMLLIWAFLLVFVVENNYADYHFGKDNRDFLVLFPSFIAYYVFTIYDSVKLYMQISRRKAEMQ